MQRAILKLGDKSSNGGVVLEGVDSCTHEGTPMTFIGAKVWCNGCKSEGVIGWKGPHQESTMLGKQEALDGDICICRCFPSPVFRASQDNAWHMFSADELAVMGYDLRGESIAMQPAGDHDERVRVLDANGRPLWGVPYHIRGANGAVYRGLTDSLGFCPRVYTNSKTALDIAVGIRALERWRHAL
ncbi:MAG TPA: PAAR domain-containing protein [Paraburkholderia sp.]|jgi:uncharacterized Zn-binding protein involved in type VI secretion|nr:PAAR domain-containing protein [Paraburkholderia sp.]